MSKLPSVVSSIPQDLKAFINQVREALDGRGADKLVTVNDLIRGGLAAPGPSNTIVPPAGVVGTPSTPKNVQASGAIQNIIVTWDDPLYNGHAYAEVWGSSTDDLGAAVQVGMTPGAIFVDAVGPSVIRYYWVRFVNVLGVQGAFNAVAGVQGVTGSDVGYLLDTLTEAALDPDSDYSKFAVRADFFYVMPSPDFNQEATPTATATGDLWYQPSTELVRTWTGSTWGSFSQTLPFVVNSSPQTINGVAVPAGVYMDAAFIKNGTITNAKIGNATIDDAKIVSLTADKITAGSIGVGSFIESTGFITGSQGWRIHGNGVAEFAAASIRGQLTAGQIDGTGLTIKNSVGTVILNATNGDFTGTLNGTATSTVVNNASTALSTANSAASTASSAQSTANSALSGLSTKLNSDARNVLAGAGGLATGTLNWNSSGVRTSGSGVGLTANGLVAYNNAGNPTFVLDGSNGNATFAGALSAATGSFAGSLSAASGTFTGSLSAATGSFSGAVSASTLSADSMDVAKRSIIEQASVTVPSSSISGTFTVYDPKGGGGTDFYPVGTVFTTPINKLIRTNTTDTFFSTSSTLRQPFGCSVYATGTGFFTGGNGIFNIKVDAEIIVNRRYSAGGSSTVDENQVFIYLRQFVVTNVSSQFNAFTLPTTLYWKLSRA
jgi:hypothetical protein